MGIRRSRLNPFNPAGFVAHAPGAGAYVRIRALSRFAASQFLSVKDIGICASELSPKAFVQSQQTRCVENFDSLAF